MVAISIEKTHSNVQTFNERTQCHMHIFMKEIDLNIFDTILTFLDLGHQFMSFVFS